VIDFEVEKVFLFLTVTNIGTTLARDVRFEIEPPLQSPIDVPLDELKMLREGISTLAPRKTIRTLFDSAIQRKPQELLDVYAVTARYSDETGRRRFEEKLDLDLGIYWNLTRLERRGQRDIHDRLKDMLAEMKKWTAGTRGLLRLSPDENRAEQDRLMRHFEEREEQREQASDETPETESPN
jgi:hypothetical protein